MIRLVVIVKLGKEIMIEIELSLDRHLVFDQRIDVAF